MIRKLLPLILLLAPLAQAKDRPSYEKATIVSMEAVHCGSTQDSGQGVAGAILGTDSEHKKTQELLCQEYVLQSDRVTYRIRAKDKHPKLLPIGGEAEFRIHSDKLLLRVREMDDKEREFVVVSMTPRHSGNDAKPTPGGKIKPELARSSTKPQNPQAV